MAPVKRIQNPAKSRTRVGRVRRSRQPNTSLNRRLASLAIRTLPKLSPRRNFSGRTNRRGAIDLNSVSTSNGCERVATITIPVNSTPGQLLFTLENNPNSAPRASAISSQFDSWHSVTELEVETTGNAFAKNFIVIRHLPNGDPSRIPTEPQSLLNFAEAYSRRYESCKLQLDSNGKGVVRAPWRGVSYNPRKPINDSDPSERNNGLFIIVSNGSPGTDPVDITIRYRYALKLYGPIFQPILPNLTASLTGGSGLTAVAPLPLNMVLSGFPVLSRTTNSLTLKAGSYLMTTNLTGTGITSGFVPSSPGVIFTIVAASNSGLNASQAWTFTLPSAAVVTFGGVIATTLTAASVFLSPFDLTV